MEQPQRPSSPGRARQWIIWWTLRGLGLASSRLSLLAGRGAAAAAAATEEVEEEEVEAEEVMEKIMELGVLEMVVLEVVVVLLLVTFAMDLACPTRV